MHIFDHMRDLPGLRRFSQFAQHGICPDGMQTCGDVTDDKAFTYPRYEYSQSKCGFLIFFNKKGYKELFLNAKSLSERCFIFLNTS